MRLHPDEAWPVTHFAFEADPEKCRALLEALARSRETAAAAYRARASQKAPDGWAPAEEDGYFVRVAPHAPPPTAEDDAVELEAFLDRHDVAHQRAVVAASRPIEPAERERARGQLAAIPDEPALAQLAALLAGTDRVAPLLWDDLVPSLERLTTLRRLGAPDVLVEQERDRCVARARRILAVADGRANEAAELRRQAAREVGLFEACLEICLGPAPEDVGVGGCIDCGDVEGVGEQLGEGERVVSGEELSRLADAARETTADLAAYRDQAAADLPHDDPGFDALSEDEQEAAIEARAKALCDAYAARARRLAARASEVAGRGGVLVVVVREAS